MATSTPFRYLLHTENLRHGTDGFTSPLKEGVLSIFFCPEKFWRLRPCLNTRTWVLKCSTLPLDHRSRFGYPYEISCTVLDLVLIKFVYTQILHSLINSEFYIEEEYKSTSAQQSIYYYHITILLPYYHTPVQLHDLLWTLWDPIRTRNSVLFYISLYWTWWWLPDSRNMCPLWRLYGNNIYFVVLTYFYILLLYCIALQDAFFKF